jgi:carboxymethylenebutenolidase
VCFDHDALPPDPARSGLLAGSERSTIDADDGNRFAVTIARTTAADPAGVVIIPDVRGLHPYYERLAEHAADAGLHAIAIDPYGRTAGAEHRSEGFDHRPHRERIGEDQLRADVRSAASALRDAGATHVVSMGFCFGGRASLLQASQRSVDGVIAFYGPPTEAGGDPSPIEEARAGLVRVPVLGLYGAADASIPREDTEAYDAALEAAGVDHRIVVYSGAPHSFFDRKMSEHADACRNAWARVLGFADSLGVR